MKHAYEVDITDYSVIKPSATYKFRALCTSHSCSRSKTEEHTDTGTVKQVLKNTDTCPDCGNYLYWEKRQA